MSAALRRCALQCAFDRFNNNVEGLRNRFPQITSLEIDGARQTGEQVQTPHIHGLLIELVVGEGGADADLDLLGRCLLYTSDAADE